MRDSKALPTQALAAAIANGVVLAQENRVSKSPLPTAAIPNQGHPSRWPTPVPPLPGEVPVPSASLPKMPLLGCEREPPPRGPARRWKMIRTERQNQYLVRPRGDYRFFSHDIRVSCTSCFSRALETQVPPRPRVARLWLCNICASQEVHVWSPGPTLVHMSGSRATLAQGLPGRLGGRGPAGDAEGNLTGSTQESTTWSCCCLPPLPSSSQPCGCTEVLASNFSFSLPHIHFLHFFSFISSCSLSQRSHCFGQGQPQGPGKVPNPCIQVPSQPTSRWELGTWQPSSSLLISTGDGDSGINYDTHHKFVQTQPRARFVFLWSTFTFFSCFSQFLHHWGPFHMEPWPTRWPAMGTTCPTGRKTAPLWLKIIILSQTLAALFQKSCYFKPHLPLRKLGSPYTLPQMPWTPGWRVTSETLNFLLEQGGSEMAPHTCACCSAPTDPTHTECPWADITTTAATKAPQAVLSGASKAGIPTSLSSPRVWTHKKTKPPWLSTCCSCWFLFLFRLGIWKAL